MTTFRILFFDFVFYSFIGWIIEGLFNLYKNNHFIKPNFLNFPIKPMYGYVATILLVLQSHLPIILFIPLCMVITTLIEYVSAYLLHHFLNLRYWNYAHKPYQFHSYICLEFSFYWFILVLILIFFLHTYTILIYGLISKFWYISCPFIFILIALDFIFTILKIKQSYKKILS